MFALISERFKIMLKTYLIILVLLSFVASCKNRVGSQLSDVTSDPSAIMVGLATK